jgi:hypothetical protein
MVLGLSLWHDGFPCHGRPAVGGAASGAAEDNGGRVEWFMTCRVPAGCGAGTGVSAILADAWRGM